MENYHIYEEKGSSKHSVVYKGREKKTVRYVAIKSVDKTYMDKVLHEVKVMYRLNHPNCLQFFQWYETRHHVWLILEYCTGGSLKDMILEDKILPESSLRVFGSDIVNALHYLHRNGVIFSDLKASNILMNEYGILKLADFALAKSINDSQQKSSEGKRGTPAYMAPELFDDDGVFSIASDFWALGCLLYEMALGHPPFSSNNLRELVYKICHEPLKLPGIQESNISSELRNLLRSLLRKDPQKRILWPELLSHKFWNGIPTLPEAQRMPSQPAFARYLESRQFLPRCTEEDSDSEEDADSEEEEEEKELTNTTSANMASDKPRFTDEPSFLRNKSKDNIPIDNLDMVLDFKQGLEIAIESDDDRPKSSTPPVELPEAAGADSPKKLSSTVGDIMSQEAPQDTTPETDSQAEVTELEASTTKESDSEITNALQRTALGNIEEFEDDFQCLENSKDSTAVLVANHEISLNLLDNEDGPRPDIIDLLTDPSDHIAKPILGNHGHSTTLPVLKFSSKLLPFENLSVDEVSLMSAQEFEAFFSHIFNALNSNSYNTVVNTLGYLYTLTCNTRFANIIVSSSLMLLMIRIASRAEVLASDTSPAGSPRNSNHFSDVSMIGAPSSPNSARGPRSGTQQQSSASRKLKVRIAVITAVLIRFSTYISPKLGEDGLINLCIMFCQDEYLPVRRYGVAGLGELLFYITANSNTPSNNEETHQWKIAGTAMKQLAICMREDSEEAIRTYAARTYENILSFTSKATNKDIGIRFANPDVASLLLDASIRSKNEGLRGSCAMALSHLVNLQRKILPRLGERDGWNFVIAGLQPMQGSIRVQQAYLNILFLVLWPQDNTDESSARRTSRTSERVTRDLLFGSTSKLKTSLIEVLVQLVSHSPSIVVRSKVLHVLTLFVQSYPKEMKLLIDNKLFLVIDRLYTKLAHDNGTDMDTPTEGGEQNQHGTRTGGPVPIQLRKSLYCLIVALQGVIRHHITTLSKITTKLSAVIVSDRQVHAHSPGANLLQQMGNHALGILIEFNTSSVLCPFICFDAELLNVLGMLVKMDTSSDFAIEFTRNLLILIEEIAGKETTDSTTAVCVVQKLIPGLWRRGIKSTTSEIQVWCLRLICTFIEKLNSIEIDDMEFVSKFRRFVESRVIPSFKYLLCQPKPMPHISVNLLYAIANPDVVSEMHVLGPELLNLLPMKIDDVIAPSMLQSLMELLALLWRSSSYTEIASDDETSKRLARLFEYLFALLVAEEEDNSGAWQEESLRTFLSCSEETSTLVETVVVLLYELLRMLGEAPSSWTRQCLIPLAEKLPCILAVVAYALEKHLYVNPRLHAEVWYRCFGDSVAEEALVTFMDEEELADVNPALLRCFTQVLLLLYYYLGPEYLEILTRAENFVYLLSQMISSQSLVHSTDTAGSIVDILELILAAVQCDMPLMSEHLHANHAIDSARDPKIKQLWDSVTKARRKPSS